MSNNEPGSKKIPKKFIAPLLLSSVLIMGADDCSGPTWEEKRQAAIERHEENISSSKDPNQLRIGDLNILGASHDNEPKHKNRPNWKTRLIGTVALLDMHQIDILGVQEFQKKQMDGFLQIAGNRYGVYPPVSDHPFPSVNSFIYNRDTIRIIRDESGVRGGYRYFTGPMSVPYVKFEHIPTDEEYMAINNHYPINRNGNNTDMRSFNADRDRDWAEALFNEGERVFVLGDHNATGSVRADKDKGISRRGLPYCIITMNGIMRHTTDAKRLNNDPDANYNCPNEDLKRIDHIYASKNVEVHSVGDVSSGTISDHPLIYADVSYSDTPITDNLSLNFPIGTELDDIEFAHVEDVYAKAEEEQMAMLALMAEVRDVYAKPKDYDSLGSQDDYNEAA